MPRIRRTAVTLVAALALPALAWAQAIAPLGPAGEAASAFPPPDRPGAETVGDAWWPEEKRDAADEAGQVARLMRLEPGIALADIGAGSGYHTIRLAPLLGPEGRLVAQDIAPDTLERLKERVERIELENVTLALGEPHDPRLSPASLDAAILVHVYHEIAQPYAFLYNLAPALRPGARVGVVEVDRPTAQHGMPPDLLRCEFEAVGYRQVGFHELTGSLGYLAVFEPPDERPAPAAIAACKT